MAAGVVLLAGLPLHALDDIVFTVPGSSPALEADLRERSLLLGAEAAGATTPQDLFSEALSEYAQLIAVLYENGHYAPVISIRLDGREAAEIPPIDVPARISRISVRIEPGPQFRFGQARVGPLAPDTTLPPDFRPGEVAASTLVSETAGAAVDGWRAIGHAKASVSAQDITADHRTATLAARLGIAPGPKLRFGPLTIQGNKRLRTDRARAIAGLPEGEVFSPEALAAAERRLRRTGVFSSVALTEDDRITAPDLLGITATLVEQKRRRFSFGAEVASFDGLLLTGSWLHRNLFGGAERLAISGAITNIGARGNGADYALDVTLDRPATFTPDTTVGLALGLAHLDEPDFRADMATLGLTMTHVFSDELTARAGVNFEFADGEDEVSAFLYRSLALPMGLTLDRRDSRTDATRGYYLDAEAKPFLGFGSTQSGLRASFDLRAYRGLGAGGRLVVAGRLQGGAVFGADLLGTPRDALFYSGGGGTVRGQPYRSLGVNILRDAADFSIGGNRFLAGSVEVRTRITDKIDAVGFLDMGYVGVAGVADTANNVHSGAGIGLRYNTGLGPLRLDVAGPVSGRTGDGIQVYVGLGQAF